MSSVTKRLPLLLVFLIGCRNNIELETLPAGRLREYTGELITHDFGLVKPSSINEHTFKFKAMRPVKPKKLSISCKCVDAQVEKRFYNRGEDIEVRVVFRSGSRSKNEVQQFRLEFEQLDIPLVTFSIRAKVQEPISVEPNSLIWDIQSAENAMSSDFVVSSFMREDERELRLSSDATWLELDATEAEPREGESARWNCRATADLRLLSSGVHEATVFATMSRGRLRIPARVEVAPPVRFFPETIFLIQRDVSSEIELRVVARGDQEAAILDTCQLNIPDKIKPYCNVTKRQFGQTAVFTVVVKASLLKDYSGACTVRLPGLNIEKLIPIRILSPVAEVESNQ